MKCKTIYVVVREYQDYDGAACNIEAFEYLTDAEDACARHTQEFAEKGITGFMFEVNPILLY